MNFNLAESSGNDLAGIKRTETVDIIDLTKNNR